MTAYIYVAHMYEVAVKYILMVQNAMRTPPRVHSVLHVDRTDMLCACTLPNGTKRIICQKCFALLILHIAVNITIAVIRSLLQERRCKHATKASFSLISCDCLFKLFFSFTANGLRL